MNTKMKVMDGNEAAAHIAYRVTELSAVYPITPSTVMGELADQWSAEGVKNIWGVVPKVVEMQSEGGAAAALHGALQSGALATTYTASQGLLLMLPNMYKIAGELTPAVIHVSARSIACQGLSIFGDHSDVMSARDTGFALLASGSVQEAHDLALIAHAATLKARVPFLHFFEGFRVSHEINKVTPITDEQIRAMIDEELVLAHRKRALNPDSPCLRGTAQNPDVFFQGRESVNPFYQQLPIIVNEYMERFAKLTGRKYEVMSYYGASDAKQIIVIMGAGSKTVKQTVDYLNALGEKVGLIQVYLYRPFHLAQFIKILPKTVETITVLDRTKEPGSLGEPLYQEILTALAEGVSSGELKPNNGSYKVVGGRYGLSSKEFTPSMVKAIFDAAKNSVTKNHFTIGINDDVTGSSLDYDPLFEVNQEGVSASVFYGLGSDGTVGANKNTIKIIGQETDLYVQGYFVYDSKKSGSKTVSHLRFSKKPIEAPYLVSKANFIGCHQFGFIDSETMLDNAAPGATFLLNSPFGPEEIWNHLPRVIEEKILNKKLKLYVIDAYQVASATGMGARINTVMQTCFFAISGILPREEAIAKIKDAIVKTYKYKGEEVVNKNFAAVDQTLAKLFEVKVPAQVSPNAYELTKTVNPDTSEFFNQVIAKIIDEKGEELVVSAMPVDGTYPTGTTKWEKRNVSQDVAEWNEELCIQCGQCGLICPHGVLRSKHFSAESLKAAPSSFKTVPCRLKEFSDHQFRLQVYVEDCTGCKLCQVVCPATSKQDKNIKAIMVTPKADRLLAERDNIKFFETIPYSEKTAIETSTVRGLQYLMPYFEFSSACAGCGETPYLKLVSQLFGDRMLVANATGCSSIYGGNLPTTPWTCNDQGRGPAWSNSLFEDNAEFGFGFKIAQDRQQELALELLSQLKSTLSADELIESTIGGVEAASELEIIEQRARISKLASLLARRQDPVAKNLLGVIEYLVKRSVWIVGGDGWAYDIGYGGLDHVLASGANVNVLVLDTEVYSNTGGQASKSTPRGAVAKFAYSGKGLARKDLGMIAMTYGSVYVAQIAIGANPAQTIKAVIEAEAYPGPSLILAYSHCIAHGYELSKGPEQQKMAVNSGFWPLYRYNPARVQEGLNPLQIDSKEPTVAVTEYARNEARFKSLMTKSPEHAEFLLKELQDDVNERWRMLTYLTARPVVDK